MKLSFFQKQSVAGFMLVCCVNLFMGCHRYYTTVKGNVSTESSKKQQISTLKDANKIFILRNGSQSYLMRNVNVDQDKMQINGTLDTVPAEHQLYISKPGKRKYKTEQRPVLTEVHLYANNKVTAGNGQDIALNLGDIDKIEIIEKDGARTTSSYILGGLGFTLGALVVMAVIIAATKSSCPYVSVYDGENFKLQGELFGGAIYPQLQREDFVPLSIQSATGEYQVKITNELKERQYTDFANLLVIDHKKDVKVLSDATGKLYTISNPQLPISSLHNNQNIELSVNNKDTKSYLFDDADDPNSTNEVYLKFDNKTNSSAGKLVLNLKNSYWFDYLYGAFAKHFGSYYGKWAKSQRKKPAGEIIQWTEEQDIPLKISIKKDGAWQQVSLLKTIGPLMNREVVIPLDVTAGRNVEVKLSTGFMFWELDYAAIDFSPNQMIRVNEIAPYQATDANNVNVLSGLLKADKQFLNQPNTGDAALLKYKIPKPEAGMTQTFLLHTSGYYEHVRDYKGVPDIGFLKTFKQPGTFSSFSKNEYLKVRSTSNIAKNN